MSTIKVRLKIYFFQCDTNLDWDQNLDPDPITGYLWKDIEWPFPFIPRAGEIIDAILVTSIPLDSEYYAGKHFRVSSSHQIVYTRDFIEIPVFPSSWLHGQDCGIHIEEAGAEYWADIDYELLSDWNVYMGSTTEDLKDLTKEQLLEKAFCKIKAWWNRHFDWVLDR